MVIKEDFIYSPNGENRRLHIYLPDDYDLTDERYPVMYFFDGHNLFYNSDATYGTCWGMKEFLDHWSKKMIVVGIECSHTGNERLHEYLPYPAGNTPFGLLESRGDQTLEWVIHEIKPAIDQALRTYPSRECTAIAGASMGGLMAIRGVVHYNQYFSKAACVSSAIGFCPMPLMVDLYSSRIDSNTRVYLSWGSREAWNSKDEWHEDPDSDSYVWNHEIAQHIEQCGGAAWAYCQVGGGHHESYWSQLVPDFMNFLWMS